MKAAILLGLATSLVLAACQIGRPLYPTGLYRTAADFRQQRPTLAGTNAGRVFLARKLFVVNATGSANRRTRVPLDSVWGYAGADHEAYRLVERGAFKVEQTDTLLVYSRREGGGKSSHTAYYYSAGLTGPVRRLQRKELRRTFAQNTTFLILLKQVKWYQSPADFDRTPQNLKSFRIVALYRQSLGLPAGSPH